MKNKIILLCCCLAMFIAGRAQLLKQIGAEIKNRVENKVIQKAGEAAEKGIDSLGSKAKKKRRKGKDENATAVTAQNGTVAAEDPSTENGPAENGAAAEAEEMTVKDGFISVEVSAKRVFAGGMLTISGESGKYKNLTSVEVTVKGPNTSIRKIVTLSADGKYSCTWNAAGYTGDFVITVKSSDGKATESVTITVYEIEGLDDIADELQKQTAAAAKKLEDAVKQVKPLLSSKDAEDLDKKLAAVKEKIDGLDKTYNSIGKACKELTKAAKKGTDIPVTLSQNLSEINNEIDAQSKRLTAFQKVTNHKPFDNTVCEYLVMINEACAAFSTATNFHVKSVGALLKNISLDKVSPNVATPLNKIERGGMGLGDAMKEPAKLFFTAQFDAESVLTKLGTAGFVGDIITFVTDYLLKKYCGIMTGTVKHDYKITFRNAEMETWWQYSYSTEAAVSLRYPKDKGSGRIVKMKGNIEGNATKFGFFQDITKEDGWKEQQQGHMKIVVIPLITVKPVAVPFATSQYDKLGFGAIARGLATPAYFNIPVDAVYNRDAGTIQLFLNEALIDFTPLVKNKVLFVVPVPLPMFRVQSFPIEKVRKTMNGVIKRSNGYKVTDNKGMLSFSDKGQFKAGTIGTDIEQEVNVSISVKQE